MESVKPPGRSKITWKEVVVEDLRSMDLNEEDKMVQN